MRKSLMKKLYITEDQISTEIHKVYEKLFCAALLQHGTEVTQKVLADYNRLKKMMEL